MPEPLRRLFFPDADRDERIYVADLFRKETVGGAVALGAALIALVLANTSAASSYVALQHLELGPLDLQHWAADGLLTVFFFVAGLELKREFTVGSLRRLADALVPVVAAACGVAVPALVYAAINLVAAEGDLAGWAIPSATDIAFAVAVLAVIGSSLPASVRIFLLTLAVVDDLIVIAIIAVFFSSELQWLWLAGAGVALAAWALLFRARFTPWWLLVPLALAAWWCTHESGIHATIAGVALGLLTRVRRDAGERWSPAERLEHRIAPFSAAVAVPFFAFFSAGVTASSPAALIASPVFLGVTAGLVLGKPIGVLLGTWAITRFTRAELNEDLTRRDVLGIAILAGIGFTVSLLVAELSFGDPAQSLAKTGVLTGSLVSAVLGAAVLSLRRRPTAH